MKPLISPILEDDEADFVSPTYSRPLSQSTAFEKLNCNNNKNGRTSSSQPSPMPLNCYQRPSKKLKPSLHPLIGKENIPTSPQDCIVSSLDCGSEHKTDPSMLSSSQASLDEGFSLSLVKSSFDRTYSLSNSDSSNMKVGSSGLVLIQGCGDAIEEADDDYSFSLVESRVDCSNEIGGNNMNLNESDYNGNLFRFEESIGKRDVNVNDGDLCNFWTEARLPNTREHCGCSVGFCYCLFNKCHDDEDSILLDNKIRETLRNNSLESKLLRSNSNCKPRLCDEGSNDNTDGNFEPGTQLNVLFKLCSEEQNRDHLTTSEFNQQEGINSDGDTFVHCPLCDMDISELSEEMRQVHTNGCLDKTDTHNVDLLGDDPALSYPRQLQLSPRKVSDISPVLDWLCGLGLEKYEEIFIQEEIDWESLQWLTEEDLLRIGVTALGPRKKIMHALNELRRDTACGPNKDENVPDLDDHREHNINGVQKNVDASKVLIDEAIRPVSNKLITDYFLGSAVNKEKGCTAARGLNTVVKSQADSSRKCAGRSHVKNGKLRDVPPWCCIPGTPFRVDAFQYLRRDCSHWFLTHFHMDHYQGLTKSFCNGKIYCSQITARLVNMKIGIPWERLEVLHVNQKANIAGIDVTFLDANHCPGSVIILFELANGKVVLHTGDFRFCEEMGSLSVFNTCHIHTLILDTTYCSPQYDFPKQDAVIQFVIESIQAEAFNPKTLFLIGSYTVGKERLFLEVARVLHKKVYVTAAKLSLLKCLGFPEEDMQWFTSNEHESDIHVVPMWSIASFKRLKHISIQYASRFDLIVAFSPTGWTFGKGKKKSPGRRWQQGTLIRYEVPYSEHSSFTELKEFVKLVSPVNIIPSVNNDGPESAKNMVNLLLS